MFTRLRHTLFTTTLVTASVAVPMASTEVPAPVPAATPAGFTEARYAAVRRGILAAERMAAGHGQRRRAGALRAMADPGRRFLFFDGRDGGRSAEVFGDLSTAGRVAVLVPGSDTSLDRYGRLQAGAQALRRELGDRAAVVAWLGYKTPRTLSATVLTPARAEGAVPGLQALVRELGPSRVSLVCHSYGTVVCGRAAAGPVGMASIILYGGAGTGTTTALRTTTPVWAARGTDDWISAVPHAQFRLPFLTLGLGLDPVSPESGARRFAAGAAAHSDYLRPGSLSLRNIAAIVSGATPRA
ncbi:Alpha/beta hydrolase [Nonomuraea solani]|uniref:Alpha/beta hydrolase n=1 Tax=Nonomuraea solani TaxID=1144553 RepID=A0A1H6EXA5_9ACTN|nr:alpha/beta hydrolase [Nonomuraea solani]SEH02487.1 Alpha/beta hydrolase [Nonomuraea solani]